MSHEVFYEERRTIVRKEEAENKTLMTSVMRSFGEGDLRPLFDAIDENIVWKSGSPSDLLRFGGPHTNRLGVEELTAQVFATYQFIRFGITETAAEGDIVWGLLEIEAIHLPSKKKIKTEAALRWRIHNSKIVEHTSFYDSATFLPQ